jgi:hypothetical protein
MKKHLEERFAELYPKKRLLAVQLNGFTHSVFYDNGRKNSDVQIDRMSFYAPEQSWSEQALQLFEGISHNDYQNNAEEIVWVKPSDR